MSIAADYAEAVLQRARTPLDPDGHVVDWADRPHRSKVYSTATRIPLPLPAPGSSGAAEPGVDAVPFDLASLGAMLHYSYGVHARRVRMSGNEDTDAQARYQDATWARGTASGGGLYSAEVYWVAGAGGPLLPGVYHYSYPHHALDRLLVGDVTDRVRSAVPIDTDARHWLLVGVKVWKNSFKYSSFSYHVVTMDVGTLLGTWQLWAGHTGRRIRAALWFDEPALDDLLGLDGVGEGVLAAVPLPWAPGHHGEPDRRDEPQSARIRVRLPESERSRTVRHFPLVDAVHRACRFDPSPPPDRIGLLAAAPHARRGQADVVLPSPRPRVDIPAALRARRSSFGAFSAVPALAFADLSDILHLAVRSGGLPAEGGSAGQLLTRCAVFAGHVAGLDPGTYDVDVPERGVGHLRRLDDAAVGQFLQWNYFLNNYNLDQAAATIAVLGRPRAVVDAVGQRGLRRLNAEVGSVGQAVYVAAAAVGVGCGAVLGFDNVAIAERLDVAGTDEWPLLLIMVGHERLDPPDLDLRLD